MRHVAAIAFGLAVAGGMFACELVDPLDDITGGTRTTGDGGKKNSSSSSSGSGSSSGDTTSSTSSSGTTSSGNADDGGPQPTCNGTHEVEPNDQNPNTLNFGISCGILHGSSDVDTWMFQNNTGAAVNYHLLVDGPSTVFVGAQSGGSSVSGNAGSALDSSVAAGAMLLVELTSEAGTNTDTAYTIHFTKN
jgi:hypothetical protein